MSVLTVSALMLPRSKTLKIDSNSLVELTEKRPECTTQAIVLQAGDLTISQLVHAGKNGFRYDEDWARSCSDR